MKVLIQPALVGLLHTTTYHCGQTSHPCRDLYTCQERLRSRLALSVLLRLVESTCRWAGSCRDCEVLSRRQLARSTTCG